MSPLELTAAAFGLASVWLTVKEHIGCWPTGLVQVTLYIVVFYEAKLYSDVLLQFVYIGMQIYGWLNWQRRRGRDELPIVLLSPLSRAAWLAAIAVVTGALGYTMATHTDASLPYSDAAVVAMSLTAQWLMAKKALENWVLWIAIDVLALYVYGTKGLIATTALYAVFLVMACIGLVTWQRTRVAALRPG